MATATAAVVPVVSVPAVCLPVSPSDLLEAVLVLTAMELATVATALEMAATAMVATVLVLVLEA